MKDWRYAVVSFSSDMFVVIEFERPRAALETDSPEAAWAEPNIPSVSFRHSRVAEKP